MDEKLDALMKLLRDSESRMSQEMQAIKVAVLNIKPEMSQEITLPDDPAPTACEDKDIDADVVYVAEAPMPAEDTSLPVPEQVEASRIHVMLLSFVPMFKPPTPIRCSTKCAEEKADQEVTVFGLGATHVTTALLDQVRSVPWLSNSCYLADLQLKPPWPSWIGSGDRLQLPLVTEEITAVGCMPQEDLLGDRVDMHHLATFLFKPKSIGEQTKLQDILVQISATSFAMQLINYHADQDTRIGMAMSSVSRELYVINLDDAASFVVTMSSSDVEQLTCLSRELHYLWQFNIDAHVSFFPWNPGGCLLGYSSRDVNFPCSYVVEESCYDILGIVQIQDTLIAMGRKLNVLDHLAQLLLSWVLEVLIERSTRGFQISVCSDVGVSSPWDPGQAADDQGSFQSLQVLCSSCPRFLQLEKMHDDMGALFQSNSWPYWQSHSLDPIMCARPEMHGLELNSCEFWVEILLPFVLVFAPDGIISFRDISDYSRDKWLFDRKYDIFGLLQLVTEAPSHDTSNNNQAHHAATLTCSLGISCLAIAYGVDFLGTRAVYSEGGSRFKQPLSTDLSSEQFHWQIAWSSQVLKFYPAVVMTLGATACSLNQVRLCTATLASSELTEGVLYISMMGVVKMKEGVLLFVHEYWLGNFGCLQWDPGGICNASTELIWGQAEPQAPWQRTMSAQLVMCSNMWTLASSRTVGKRYRVRACGLGPNFNKVQTTWDPGGILLMHRLEGKPIFKNGGMSRTRYTFGSWAVTRRSRGLGSYWTRLHKTEKGIEGDHGRSIRNGCFGRDGSFG